MLDSTTNLYSSPITDQIRAKVLDLLVDVTTTREPGTYFFRSDTGTGKTTGLIAALPELTQRGLRLLIAVPTNNDVEEVSKLAGRYIDPELVGYWSSDHQKGVYPNYDLTRAEAGERQVFIGTHKNLLGDIDPRQWVGQRDLVIIDEIPATMQMESLGVSEMIKAQEVFHSNAMALPETTRDLYGDIISKAVGYALQRQDAAQSVPQASFKVTKSLPSADQLRAGIMGIGMLEVAREVKDTLTRPLDYLLGLIEGRAFERVQRTPRGHSIFFVSFQTEASWVDRRVIFSATAHLDGFQVSPHAPNIDAYSGSFVSYENLTVMDVPWPDVPHFVNELVRQPKAVQLATDTINDLISRATGDEVLVVMPKAIMDWVLMGLRVPEGKLVHTTNWGRDVGSNEYRNCSDVILFGNHHKPKHATLAEFFIYSNRDVTKDSLADTTQQGKLKPVVLDLERSQLLAAIKQMGCRGRARFADDQGVCGQMNLWICWNGMNPVELETIFPGYSYVPLRGDPKLSKTAKKSAGFLDRALNALSQMSEDVTEVTLRDLSEAMGVTLDSVKRRGSNLHAAKEELRLQGWLFIPGKKGRYGTPTKLVRAA